MDSLFYCHFLMSQTWLLSYPFEWLRRFYKKFWGSFFEMNGCTHKRVAFMTVVKTIIDF